MNSYTGPVLFSDSWPHHPSNQFTARDVEIIAVCIIHEHVRPVREEPGNQLGLVLYDCPVILFALPEIFLAQLEPFDHPLQSVHERGGAFLDLCEFDDIGP
ncbi:MAG: hypothetical protein A4E42_00995 [Methanoregulaceae archaeon PtaU1.Bin222]|nr:MAG: hypothetical protein A4E42_00995 [Methanoregulaceae archaeon PtaU1.Bin222]